MSEMTLFMLLIVPLPYSMKRRLFTFISESPLVAKAQYALKVRLIPKRLALVLIHAR